MYPAGEHPALSFASVDMAFAKAKAPGREEHRSQVITTWFMTCMNMTET
jgi:hypothetical protein